jgi:cystathionine gamma-synthase
LLLQLFDQGAVATRTCSLDVAADEVHFAGLREAREPGGAAPGALEAFLCLRGLRSLPLRLERAQHNARVLAERLEGHPEVTEVRYPGLASHPQHQRSRDTLAGAGPMITHVLRAPRRRSSPSSRTRRASLASRRRLSGARATLLSWHRARRPAALRVGSEHVEDLWVALQQALTSSADVQAAR